jgi:N-acetylneuraminic acid mutarotase
MKAVLWFALAACSSPAPHPDALPTHWSEGPMVPTPRLEPGVTAMGQRVIVLGGFDTDLMAGLDITRRVDVFDPATGTWTQFPDAPVAWTHVQLAAIGTTLYLLGGLEGQTYTARGEAYALDTLDPALQWRTLAPMPPGLERGSAAVVVAPPRVYLFGGAGTSSALATNLFYDAQSDTWGQLAPDLPAPRSHPAAMRRVDGTFVVTGGLATLDSTSQAGDTWILAPLGTMWEPKAPMPNPRGGCAYGVVEGQLICAGGEAGPSAYRTVESYDPLADMWTELEDMPDNRAGTQGAAIGTRLFVPGGARELVFEPEQQLYVYTANL